MKKEQTFLITGSEMMELISKDPILEKLIRKVGDMTLSVSNEEHYRSLVLSIVGQQLSAKAAGTIRARLIDLVSKDGLKPETILSLSDDEIRGIGVSRPKIRYMKDLSEKVLNKEVNFDLFPTIPNEEVITQLTTIKGIGKWTAEMFLIFSLGRLNVMSFGDAGLQRATKWLFQMEDREDKKYLEQHHHKWSPYESVASLYLWEAIDLGFVDQYKTIDDIL